MMLSTLRDQIDRINRELVHLLGRRLAIAKDIARLKKEHKLPILDPERESTILKEIKSLAAQHQLSSVVVEEIFQLILETTRIEMGAIE